MKTIVLTLSLLFIPFMGLAYEPGKGVIKSLEIEKIELKEINLAELQATAQKSCSTYRCPGSNALDWYHPNSPVKNCICKNIDKGLKPICEQEQVVKGLLKQKYSKNKTKDLKDYLAAIQNVKGLFVKEIYEMADEFNDMHDTIQDGIAEAIRTSNSKEDAFQNGLLTAVSILMLKNEKDNFTNFLDHRVQKACGNFD